MRNIKIDKLTQEEVLSTLTFDKELEYFKDHIDFNQIDKSYINTHFILAESAGKFRNRSDLNGLDDALKLLAHNKNEKIILMGFLSEEQIRKLDKETEIDLFLSYENTQYVQLPIDFNKLLKKPQDSTPKTSSSKNNQDRAQLISKHAIPKILLLRHSLGKSTQNMSDAEKKDWLNEVQEYFPGLKTFEKALDYILHTDIDFPEVMKGKRIEGVYADVDGTLIEYVGINSGKEGTQQLREKVVKLLKRYEDEGKKITIWTGGDIEMKEKHLKSLGITRPVVSKYDYAGATAEIVVDDKDENTFIAKSKINPETFINTGDWE